MHTTPVPRRLFVAAAAACALVSMTGRAAAPSTLRILVGSTPGSVPDLVARRIAERLGREDRVVLVDNRMGAAGRLAINGLRSAPADGTILLLAPGAIATMYPRYMHNPATTRKPTCSLCRPQPSCVWPWRLVPGYRVR